MAGSSFNPVHRIRSRAISLMTSHRDGRATYERIQCELASKGVLHRVSLSPSETKVCFEFQTGFQDDAPGRTLYMASFDASLPAITDALPFANQDGKPIRYAYPRWSKDESAIVFQVQGQTPCLSVSRQVDDESSVTELTGDSSPQVGCLPFFNAVMPFGVMESIGRRRDLRSIPNSPLQMISESLQKSTSANNSRSYVSIASSSKIKSIRTNSSGESSCHLIVQAALGCRLGASLSEPAAEFKLVIAVRHYRGGRQIA